MSSIIYLIYSEKYGCSVFNSIAGILAATSRDSFKREATSTISRPSHGQNGWLHIHITGATGDIALGMSPQLTASPFWHHWRAEGLLSKSLLVVNDASHDFCWTFKTLTNFNTLTNLNPRKRPLTHRHLPNHGGPCEKCAGFAFHHSFHPHLSPCVFIKCRGDTAATLAFCGRHLLFDFPVSQPPNLGVLWNGRNGRIGMFEERNICSPKKAALPRDDFAPASFHFQFPHCTCSFQEFSRLNRSTCTALKHISIRVQFETPLLNEMWVSSQVKRRGGWESKLGVPNH